MIIKTYLTAAWISLDTMSFENTGLYSYSNNFSIFITGSSLISCFFSSVEVTADVDVASHLTGGDFILRAITPLWLLLFIASELMLSWSFTLESTSSVSNCFRRFSANVVVRSRCESNACNSWSLTPGMGVRIC